MPMYSQNRIYAPSDADRELAKRYGDARDGLAGQSSADYQVEALQRGQDAFNQRNAANQLQTAANPIDFARNKYMAAQGAAGPDAIKQAQAYQAAQAALPNQQALDAAAAAQATTDAAAPTNAANNNFMARVSEYLQGASAASRQLAASQAAAQRGVQSTAQSGSIGQNAGDVARAAAWQQSQLGTQQAQDMGIQQAQQYAGLTQLLGQAGLDAGAYGQATQEQILQQQMQGIGRGYGNAAEDLRGGSGYNDLGLRERQNDLNSYLGDAELRARQYAQDSEQQQSLIGRLLNGGAALGAAALAPLTGGGSLPFAGAFAANTLRR